MLPSARGGVVVPRPRQIQVAVADDGVVVRCQQRKNGLFPNE
jgi:hypothetical protein